MTPLWSKPINIDWCISQKKTRVSLDCPDKQVRDTLEGLHRLPLACDIITDTVFWPAKQTLTINVKIEPMNDLDSTSLPLINISGVTKVGKSLKELLAKLPDKDEKYTIDFDSYNLSLKEVQSYSIYAHSITLVVLTINSIIIGYLLFRKLIKNNQSSNEQSFFKHNFNKLRDSIRSGRAQFRSSRSNMRSRSREVRRSINKFRNSLRRGNNVDNVEINQFPEEKISENNLTPNITVSSKNTVGTNTDTPPPYNQKIYPMISRY